MKNIIIGLLSLVTFPIWLLLLLLWLAGDAFRKAVKLFYDEEIKRK